MANAAEPDHVPAPAPVLKPYAGVGDSFLQRHALAVVTLTATAACLPYGFYYAVLTPWLLVPLLVPIVILAALIVWALPDGVSVPDQALERMFFAFFTVLILWPNYLAMDLAGLPWITLSRIIGTPMTLITLIGVSTSPVFRARMAAILSTSPLVWKSLTIFVVLQFMSLPFSRHPGDSIAQFVVAQATQTAIFFVACYVFRKPGRTLIWASMLWAMAMMVCLIGAIEYTKTRVLWAGSVPGFLTVHDEIVDKILQGATRMTTGQYRAQSVFTTSLGLSEFLALAMPFVIHFGASRHYRPLVRALAWISIPIMIYVILLTDSRLGILGLFLSTMLYLLIWSVQQLRRNKTSLIPPALLVAYPTFFIMFVGASFTVGRIKAKVWGTGQYDDSNQARKDQLAQGIPKVFSHPLGHGTGMSGEALGFTNPAGDITIDNFLLSVALDYGILGLLGFLIMFGVSAYTAAKYALGPKEREPEFEFMTPLAICILVFLFIKTVFAQDDNHPLLYIAMGIITGLSYRIRQAELTEGAAVSAAAPARRAAILPGLRTARM